MKLKHIILASILILFANQLSAQVLTTFRPKFQTTQKGGIRFLSNVATTCFVADTATAPPGGISNNGNLSRYVDRDGVIGTFSSTSDSLALASCSEITFVGLYWGGYALPTNPRFGNKNQIKIKAGNNSYIDISADTTQTFAGGSFTTYHCFKDITSIFQTYGNNKRWWVANVIGDTITQNRFAGWNIVIVYRNDLQNMRQLTVFNGLANVSSGNAINIPVSGFLTPPTGPISFEMGIYCYDGDRSTTGDSLKFKGKTIFKSVTDGLNPANNAFNSTISYNGTLTPFRIPNYSNNFSIDADIFIPDNSDTTFIGHSATSCILRQSSAGDVYLTQAVSFAIDVYSPDDRASVKVNDINGGSVEPGDTLEYTVVGKNIGSDPSINTFITDTLEQNSTFVPGSIIITSGPNLGAKSDAAADDQAEYNSTTRTIKVRIGTGANGASGGQVNNSTFGTDSTQFKFRVTASTDCFKLKCDNVINNSALITGTGITSGKTYNNKSNPGIFDINGCPIPGATTTPINSAGCLLPPDTTISICGNALLASIYTRAGYAFFNSSFVSINNVSAATTVYGIYTPYIGCSDTTQITITVNCAPVATNDAATVVEDGILNGSVSSLASDSDGNLDVNSFAAVTNTTNGLLLLNSNGTYTYTPNSNFNGNDTFSYKVCDLGSPIKCDTAFVVITVTPINDALIITPDVNTTNEDTPVSGNILTAGDIDPDGTTLTVNTTPVSGPSNGLFSINATGNYTYTPNANFNGNDTIVLTVCDNGTPLPASCKNDTLVITVTPINDEPVANNNSNSTNEDTPITFNITNNDTDADGTIAPATVDLDPTTLGQQTTVATTEGTWSVATNGDVTFSPAANFNGIATLPYTVNDNSGATSNIATLTVTVNPVNDPIVVNNDVNSTNEDTPVSGSILSAGDFDADGTQLTPSTTPITGPYHGTIVINTDGSYTYTPNANYNGPDQVVIQLCDNGIPLPPSCKNDTLNLTVLPVNDLPIANNDVAGTSGTTSVTKNIVNNDTDVDGAIDPTTVDLDPSTPGQQTTSAAPGGTFTVDNLGNVTFTPDGTVSTGNVCTNYTVKDNGTPMPANTSNVATFCVSMGNLPPVANNDSATTNEDTPVTFNITSNDADLDGTINAASVDLDPSTLGIQTSKTTTEGTWSVAPNGDVTFTPTANFNGVATLPYTVNDNSGATSAPATLVVMVTPVNDPIVVTPDVNTTPEDVAVIGNVITAGDNDNIDGTPVTASTAPAKAPLNGSIVINPNGSYTYTPNPNFNGNDTILIQLCDNGNPLPPTCKNDTLIITVTPVNDAPIANNDVANTSGTTPVTKNIVNNDTDVDGAIDPTTVDLDPSTPGQQTTSAAPGGTFTVDNLGNVTFTPDGTVSTGNVCTNYTVKDNGTPMPANTSNVATFCVSMGNLPPVANNDSSTTNEDTPITFNITSNDADLDGTINATSVDLNPSSPGIQTTATTPQGAWSVDALGNVTFTPNLNFNGVATLPYTVNDNSGIPSNIATIKVTVTPVNDPIVVDNDANTILEDNIANGNVIGAGNSDPDGTPITATITPLLNPKNGAIVVQPNGNYTYTPNPNWNGKDTIVIQLCDQGIPLPPSCKNDTLVITVLPVNDAPIANPNTGSTTGTNPVTLNITNNDTDLDGSIDPTTVDLDPSTPGQQTTSTVPGGTFTVDNLGNVTFIPNGTVLSGSVCTNYTVNDNGTPMPAATSNVSTVCITLGNVSPVITPKSVNVPEDSTTTICTTVTDDPAQTLTPTLCGVTNGTVGTPTIVSGQLCITFTPNPNYNGPASICLIVCDNGTPSLCDTVNIPITVTPVNDIPSIMQPPITTPEDSSITICPTLADIDGDTLTVSICSVPLHGTATVVGNCVIYTPNPNYNGQDSVCIKVCDNGTPQLCNQVVVPITVTPVNHPPVTTNISTTVASGTNVPINVAAGTSDPDGDPLTYTYGLPTGMPATATVTGNGTIVIHPTNATDTGIVTIHFSVCDNGTPSLCDTGIITVHFIPDSILAISPLPPVATNDNTSTNPGTSVIVNVKGNDSDPNGNNTIGLPTIILNPKNGTASIDTSGNIVYTPNNTFIGNDTLTYYICDNGTPTKCDTALVIISITTSPTPNHPPVATDDYVSTNQNTAISIIVKGNDSDPDGNVLGNPTIIVNPINGTVSVDTKGNVIYTPNTNYFGLDTFTYVICDMGIPSKCDTAVVYITINQSIFPVVIANNDYGVTNISTNIIIPILNNDSSSININDHINISIASQPLNGNATVIGNTILYSPNTGFIGIDTFIYILCDTIGSQVNCSNAFVVITIKPIANNDEVGTTTAPIDCGGRVINFIMNDSVGINNNVSVKIISNPSFGTANLAGTNIIYVPNNGYSGDDIIIYELTVNGLMDTATIILHVQCTLPLGCDVPNIITPNNDGVNDYLVIDCALNYPNNELTIYNRWGNEVYSQKTYNNNWDAKYRDDNLPDGTYYYVFKTNNSTDDKKVGFIQVSH